MEKIPCCSLTYLFWLVNCVWSMLISLLIQVGGGGGFHRRKNYVFNINVKNVLMELFYTKQRFSSQDVNWWTGVMLITCVLLWCFYQLFGLSFWRHPFTAEDPIFGWTIPLSPEFPSWGRVRCNGCSICIVGGLPETNYNSFSCRPRLQQYFIIVIEYLTLQFTALYK